MLDRSSLDVHSIDVIHLGYDVEHSFHQLDGNFHDQNYGDDDDDGNDDYVHMYIRNHGDSIHHYDEICIPFDDDGGSGGDDSHVDGNSYYLSNDSSPNFVHTWL